MRPHYLPAGTLLVLCLAACSEPARDQEEVTVPGEGPTYLNDSVPTPPVVRTPGGAGVGGDTLSPATPRDTAGRPPGAP